MHPKITFTQPAGLRSLLLVASLSLLSNGTLAAQLPNATLSSLHCQADSFEPNDLNTQAAPLQIGTTTGLNNAHTHYDHYQLQVAAGMYVEITLRVQSTSAPFSGFFDINEILSGGNGSPITLGNGAGRYFHDAESEVLLVFNTPTYEPTNFLLSLFTFGSPGSCAEYEIDVVVSPSQCGHLASDVFLNNRECTSPAPLGQGTYTGLGASVSERDYYLVDVAPGDLATFEVYDVTTPGQADIHAWKIDDACVGGPTTINGGAIIYEDSGGIYIPNTTEVTQSFVVLVEPVPLALEQAHLCMSYSMQLTSEPAPCGGFTGDRFEPNDTWQQAALLTSSEPNLTSTSIDSDYFNIEVPAGATLTVTRTGTLFPRSFSLYSEAQEFYLQGGEFIGNDQNDIRHRIEWTNPWPDSRSTVLFVAGNSTFPGPFCGSYDLEIDVALGSPFCSPSVNSTGLSAQLSGHGSQEIGQGNLILTASPTPQGQLGLTIFGQGTGTPTTLGGGLLCIQGTLRRLPIATPIDGGLQTTIDWQNPGPAIVILQGSTWSFQTWYRDIGGQSNVSEGLELTFQ